MNEYIDREAAQTSCRKYSFAESYDAFAVDCILKAIPAADVAPVRHGRWICKRKGYEEYECSVCHGMDSNCSDYYADHVVTEQEYCPFCGAKMDLEG